MIPSDQFVKDAQASCEVQLAAKSDLLWPFVRARARRAEAAAMAAYRDAVAEYAMRRLLEILVTFPDDFPEENVMCVLDSIISGLPTDTLEHYADLAIHPPFNQLH